VQTLMRQLRLLRRSARARRRPLLPMLTPMTRATTRPVVAANLLQKAVAVRRARRRLARALARLGESWFFIGFLSLTSVFQRHRMISCRPMVSLALQGALHSANYSTQLSFFAPQDFVARTSRLCCPPLNLLLLLL
jgi:hypothetical protein